MKHCNIPTFLTSVLLTFRTSLRFLALYEISQSEEVNKMFSGFKSVWVNLENISCEMKHQQSLRACVQKCKKQTLKTCTHEETWPNGTAGRWYGAPGDLEEGHNQSLSDPRPIIVRPLSLSHRCFFPNLIDWPWSVKCQLKTCWCGYDSLVEILKLKFGQDISRLKFGLAFLS